MMPSPLGSPAMSLPRSLAPLLLALSWLGSASCATAQTFSGIGRAKDGDSLMVGTREVRLFGIDAPEFKQQCQREGRSWACGMAAFKQLQKTADGETVTCQSLGTDPNGRTLGRCSVGATELNRMMVASGLAVAFRRYSFDYVSEEGSARQARLGLWAGQFEEPSEYRLSHQQQLPGPRAEPRGLPPRREAVRAIGGACRIKGNQNRRGQMIYHLPGMPYYEQTRAEQMFCTEAEAQAAGYRRAVASR